VQARSAGGFTPLLFAAKRGDVESARALLDAGADPNAPAPDGSTPLLVAVASAQEAVAMLLLERGSDASAADAIGYSPLHATVWKPSAKEGLFRSNSSASLVKALLSHGANANARIVKDPAPLPGSYFFQLGLVGATPFWLAAKAGNIEVMRALAEGGADLTLANKDGTTAVMVASGLGQGQGPGSVPEKKLVEAVRSAIDLGADVNTINENGQTAAHGAANAGFDSILRVLAERGANLNVKDKKGQTPLSTAQARNAARTVALLRTLGAAADDAAAQDREVSPLPRR
jgi:ankyrin repeat protein